MTMLDDRDELRRALRDLGDAIRRALPGGGAKPVNRWAAFTDEELETIALMFDVSGERGLWEWEALLDKELWAEIEQRKREAT